MMKRLFFILLALLPIVGFSQVKIKMHIAAQHDSVWYLMRYRGSKTALVDTLKCHSGTTRYLNMKKLPEGIYLLESQNNIPMTEILLGKKQIVSIKIKDLNSLSKTKVRGSKETKRYFKLMERLRRNEMQIAALESEGQQSEKARHQIDSLKKDLVDYGKSLKIKDEDSFLNLFINSLKRHTMQDYWDDFALNDARILTYPLIDNKLESYFNNLPVNAKTINGEIDKLIAKTGDCIEVRDYLIWYFYRKYYSPQYMNLDDVYIHLVDEYFLKLEMENVSESVVNMMADRAQYLDKIKIGKQIPPISNLYHVEADYIALIFFDKTCKKCAQEGRVLQDIQTRHPEMKIYPVEVNSGMMDDMLMVYDIQTTPTIYLLDSNKRIIAKRIKAEQVEQFLKPISYE